VAITPDLMVLAGIPATISLSRTFCSTTAPAETTASFPIFTRSRITAPIPTNVPPPISTLPATYVGARTDGTAFSCQVIVADQRAPVDDGIFAYIRV